ncbi:UDP-2,4-diacetamido-2,4,6-trideoxy-beta-L-altropyranose hydrolase [Clostridium botulinum]|uniref:UDP-2,4-diacetamido-2,4, 6-trideoxy-beta-L-altropyranose hydrolase n=1 Tax=Clostridium botulinum TaxID=1491 RepID=UPI0001F84B2A|nr:UDP-2,4-diacetamido-2,4,6-trideoxy-beta-L-altropyranose hydrolase [Clostridium botulinum]NFB16725.1 UDP-2,4-diacetamido-2,4,6-trideoxy-beta-L-altropyranose hydrolase [Clostridium botulinum]NFB66410.1 UDP-2,4-diacetamido-2,4,6-trideoxy-beta-L-altropyranose hydrolase [Clostridium botulinum]NFB98038.1 UDP-2,4-diacetamido-2,4,6-trideoxy-beta-L-altropyranose hydrolase [Clostridium botulinum]NFC47699.1 UDP-2,4-diacetamido-2,4,6-trideoxy-beta-L-altropyranose hydrolase [Clostridium botulinum]NFC590
MKIAIRAEGGSQIGMGHIMRTLVLAKELAKTNDVFYICKVDTPLSSKYIPGIDKAKSEGFKLLTINENNFIKELCKVKADCLITDSYDVNEEYFNLTKDMFKITGYIDDMNLYNFNVDFVINQNIGAEEYSYKVNKDTKLFLGSKYTMLREEFRKNPKKPIKKEVQNIMITVGGADPNGIINIICDYIKDLEFKYHIVIGPSFKEGNVKKLIKLKNSKDNINLYFNANMIGIMNKCDIAISGCGSTLYELAACSIPTLGLIIADNQEKIAQKMHKEGLIYNLGWYTDLTKNKIVENIEEISKIDNRQEMIKNQKIINRNGVEELSRKIEFYKNYELHRGNKI